MIRNSAAARMDEGAASIEDSWNRPGDKQGLLGSKTRSMRTGSVRTACNQSTGQHVTLAGAIKPAIPVGIGGADGRGRTSIRIETQGCQRRGAPVCAVQILAVPPAPAAQPSHGGARHCTSVIPRTGDYGNRHLTRDRAPPAPAMELRKIVRPHQPYKPPFWVAPLEFAQRIKRVARTHFGFDRSDANRRAPRHLPGRPDPSLQRCHAFGRLENVAGRDQPPHLIQPQSIARKQTDPPMRTMRRIETASEQAGQLAFQGRICPEPSTSHL